MSTEDCPEQSGEIGTARSEGEPRLLDLFSREGGAAVGACHLTWALRQERGP